MKTKLYITLSGLCMIYFLSCKENKTHPFNFYYWKSEVSIEETEQAYFEKLNCKNLYIRYFDVDNKGNGTYPVAKIKKFNKNVLDAEYIPVVFITNRSFINTTERAIQELAKNVCNLITEINDTIGLPQSKEIQIDCDWTESTQRNYFLFLNKLKEITGTKISCTLRLHQIAYKEKTGIPPVSKGYLMCYATSQPAEFSSVNSILNIGLLKKYTKNINDYTLPFDVALPLYSWAVVINHLGKAKLINGVTEEDIKGQKEFRPLGDGSFEAGDDFFFHGIYINKGFKIKAEGISPPLLNEAKTYLSNKIKRDYSIIYYHLDKPFLERFDTNDLK